MIEPGWRQQESGRHQGNSRPEPEPLCRTRPGPVLRQTHQASRQRPSFHHDTAPDQFCSGRQPSNRHRHGIRLGGDRGGTSGSPHPFDQGTEHFRTPRRHDEVPGVRQEAEGQQMHVVCPQQRAQLPQEASVVGGPLELCLAGDQTDADVKIAGGGWRFAHREVSSTSGNRKRRATGATRSLSVETPG